jgi:hypothetical protein
MCTASLQSRSVLTGWAVSRRQDSGTWKRAQQQSAFSSLKVKPNPVRVVRT